MAPYLGLATSNPTPTSSSSNPSTASPSLTSQSTTSDALLHSVPILAIVVVILLASVLAVALFYAYRRRLRRKPIEVVKHKPLRPLLLPTLLAVPAPAFLIDKFATVPCTPSTPVSATSSSLAFSPPTPASVSSLATIGTLSASATLTLTAITCSSPTIPLAAAAAPDVLTPQPLAACLSMDFMCRGQSQESLDHAMTESSEGSSTDDESVPIIRFVRPEWVVAQLHSFMSTLDFTTASSEEVSAPTTLLAEAQPLVASEEPVSMWIPTTSDSTTVVHIPVVNTNAVPESSQAQPPISFCIPIGQRSDLSNMLMTVSDSSWTISASSSFASSSSVSDSNVLTATAVSSLVLPIAQAPPPLPDHMPRDDIDVYLQASVFGTDQTEEPLETVGAALVSTDWKLQDFQALDSQRATDSSISLLLSSVGDIRDAAATGSSPDAHVESTEDEKSGFEIQVTALALGAMAGSELDEGEISAMESDVRQKTKNILSDSSKVDPTPSHRRPLSVPLKSCLKKPTPTSPLRTSKPGRTASSSLSSYSKRCKHRNAIFDTSTTTLDATSSTRSTMVSSSLHDQPPAVSAPASVKSSTSPVSGRKRLATLSTRSAPARQRSDNNNISRTTSNDTSARPTDAKAVQIPVDSPVSSKASAAIRLSSRSLHSSITSSSTIQQPSTRHVSKPSMPRRPLLTSSSLPLTRSIHPSSPLSSSIHAGDFQIKSSRTIFGTVTNVVKTKTVGSGSTKRGVSIQYGGQNAGVQRKGAAASLQTALPSKTSSASSQLSVTVSLGRHGWR